MSERLLEITYIISYYIVAYCTVINHDFIQSDVVI